MLTFVGLSAGVQTILQMGGIAIGGTILSNIVSMNGNQQFAKVIDIGMYGLLLFFGFQELSAGIGEIKEVFHLW